MCVHYPRLHVQYSTLDVQYTSCTLQYTNALHVQYLQLPVARVVLGRVLPHGVVVAEQAAVLSEIHLCCHSAVSTLAVVDPIPSYA